MPSEKPLVSDSGAVKGAVFNADSRSKPAAEGDANATAPRDGQAGDAAGERSAGGFADAIAGIVRLPLTDAEKADAVRRLLGDAGRGR